MRWGPATLDSLCSHTFSGGTPSTVNDAYYGGDIPWLRTQEVIFGRIFDTEIKITEAGFKNSSAKWVPEKSVIVAMYGNSAGRSAINEIPLTTNQACCNLVIDPDKADYRYVFYALLRSYEVLKGLSRGAAQNNLNAAQVKAFTIPAPSVQVQRNIGDILSAYDDRIENNRRRMALLEESARQLYSEWFVRLRFPGHEHTPIVDGVPKGWEQRTAFDSMHVLSGGTPKTTVPDYWDGDTPFFTPKDATDGIWVSACERSVTELGIKNCNSKLYPRETVFITARGTVGKLNMAQVPMAMSQSCYALVGKDHLSQRFVYSAMEAGVDALRQQAVGAVFDAIVVDTFKRIKLMVPPVPMLRLFDEAVTPVFDQVENLALQNQKLRTARDLLLPRLMSGELSV